MKNILLTLSLLLVAFTGAAQQPWTLPGEIDTRMQPARTQLRSYSSQAAAIERQGGDSQWIREIGEWTLTRSDGAEVFSSVYQMPFAWIDRVLMLRIPRAGGSYTVTINGVEAGYSQASKTPAEFEVTKFTREGMNRIEITMHEPSIARTIENYRRGETLAAPSGVCVIAQPKLRVRDIVWKGRVNGTDGAMSLGVVVKSHLLNIRQVRVNYELLAPDGKRVSYGYKDSQFEMKDEDTVSFFSLIPDVRAWSAAQPDLYTLVVKMQVEGRYTEYIAQKVGFRTLGAQDGALTVNGAKVRLNIAEFTPSGVPSDDRRQVEALKRTGINALRLTPYPQSDEFYAMCDAVGLYLIDQADVDTHLAGNSRKLKGNPSNDPAWCAAFVQRGLACYRNSQLHPSVVAYCPAFNSANGYCLYESYLALKAACKDRPIVYPWADKEWNTDATAGTGGGLFFRWVPAEE